MVILGLDPGLATTGYAVIKKDRGNIQAIDWGIIETGKALAFSERLAVIAKDLQKIIVRHRPALAAVEQLFFAKNAKTAIQVAHARGVLLQTLQLRKVKVLEYTPLQVKIRITGYGGAPKQQIQQMIKQQLHLSKLPRPDDAADALALAVCASCANLHGI